MIAKSRPFSGLSPDVVLDAAASVGFESDGRLFALNSYENRVYRLGAGAQSLVLKFYRPERWSDAQIEEEHAFALELAAAELPVAAPLRIGELTLLSYRDYRFAAFPCLAGRAPELDAPDARVVLGRTIARIHAIGASRSFRSRPRIGIERLGLQAREQVLASELLPEGLAMSYTAAADTLLERARRAFVSAGPVHDMRIHGDCHQGNLLWNEHGPVFVDLDDCASGPRIQDLWMLLSGDASEQQRQWNALLEGYSQFGDIDLRELTLVEPLRALRMLHHAAWVVQRWEDPAFPRAFPWFGEARYWERHIGDLLEQAGAIDDPPLLQR
jgi:Ser/Thr protein kinase RdoA (MazF antagonist)